MLNVDTVCVPDIAVLVVAVVLSVIESMMFDYEFTPPDRVSPVNE